ncbi:MAG: hypothetical protein JW849_03895 [Phycisphaerae bacterium]|nr:hypothetical protein [Phycisphaerae bacterium]
MAERSEESKTPKSPSRDRWIKIGFVLVLAAAGIAVYCFQRRDLHIEGWGDNLAAALNQARTENRMVVVFFASSPPSDTALTIARRRIPKPDNKEALKAGNFIPVVASLKDALDSDLAKQYKLKTLPTLMVLRPNGTERNRHEGMIGEVDFRQNFLERPSK